MNAFLVSGTSHTETERRDRSRKWNAFHEGLVRWLRSAVYRSKHLVFVNIRHIG